MFGTQQGQQGVGLKINKLMIQDSGTYNVQYRRPYQTHLEGSTLGLFRERTGGSESIAPAQLAGFAGQFISPQATPESAINIPQGWNEVRCRFMMEIEYDYYTGGRITEIVLGFTDHVGITHTGMVDPNMQFFVSSVTHLRTTPMPTATGRQAVTNVIESSQVLMSPVWQDIYTPQREQMLRPTDIFSVISRSHLPPQADVMDLRNAMTNNAVKSRRANNQPAAYTARILQSYKHAAASQEQGAGEQEILGQARGFVNEASTGQDPFLRAVNQIQQHQGIGNFFTYKDLMELYPDVVHVTVPVMLMPTERMQVHQAGQTADWGAANQETLVATSLSNSVPALMAEVGLTRLIFTSTNRTIGGAMLTTIVDADSFGNIDLTQPCHTLMARLEGEVLRDLTYENSIDYAIEMRVDLVGETWLKMSLNGQAEVDYVTPSFCDALLAPVITSNVELTRSLAEDFETLTNEVLGPSNTSVFAAGGSGGGFNTLGGQGGSYRF